MRNQTALEELSAKVMLLIEKYNRTKEENEKLINEVDTLKKIIEEQRLEIIKLKEEDKKKNMEIEDITRKITRLLA
jgi:chromosome segregation ATPase